MLLFANYSWGKINQALNTQCVSWGVFLSFSKVGFVDSCGFTND